MEKTMRMTPEFYSTTLKRKRVMVEQEYEYFLNISVHEGEDIDCVTRHWNGETRIYRVFGWVNPGEEFVTPAAQGLPDPAWNIKYQVPLGRYDPYNYLKLEVVRVTSKSNPAPRRTMDSGIVADGHITLAMEVMRRPTYFYAT
ncbi:hypothetical protein RND71_030695 [Anisodus tanguticus]|uniref:Uncharacterized protein n=1 Tax=Anisodus tanguticus TaxID=243964 RepID=A0AAE1V193_9SOLA|nr:hypothetical protein RND71_030695 [Anisodus tanguticus]